MLLFFERVYFFTPSHRIIKTNAIDERRVILGNSGNVISIKDFDYFQDTTHSMHLHPRSLPLSLRTTVELLEKEGILRYISVNPESDSTLHSLANRICRPDLANKNLLILDKNNQDGKLTFRFENISLTSLSDGAAHKIHAVIPNVPVIESEWLMRLCFYARQNGLAPVFVGKYENTLIEYRNKDALKYGIENDYLGDISTTGLAGNVSYSLAMQWLDDSVLDRTSVTDICKFRRATDEIRHRYVHEVVSGLMKDLDIRRWTPEVNNELQRFVQLELIPSLERYQESCKAVWNRMLTNSISTLGKGSVWGVAAYTGQPFTSVVLPEMDHLSRIILSSMAAAVKCAPGMIDVLKTTYDEYGACKRNSLAYLARISRNIVK